MIKKILTKEQKEEILKNPNVINCTEKTIHYKPEFKLLCLKQYKEGLSAREIFQQAGFNVDLINHRIPKWSVERWQKIFRKRGEEGLKTDSRGRGGGRKKIKWFNDKEKIKHLETEIAYLKAENDFLAKLRKKS